MLISKNKYNLNLYLTQNSNFDHSVNLILNDGGLLIKNIVQKLPAKVIDTSVFLAMISIWGSGVEITNLVMEKVFSSEIFSFSGYGTLTFKNIYVNMQSTNSSAVFFYQPSFNIGASFQNSTFLNCNFPLFKQAKATSGERSYYLNILVTVVRNCSKLGSNSNSLFPISEGSLIDLKLSDSIWPVFIQPEMDGLLEIGHFSVTFPDSEMIEYFYKPNNFETINVDRIFRITGFSLTGGKYLKAIFDVRMKKRVSSF